ncbi:heme biosynthesis HemY N-terminal domain-containing protein [Anderseniella sp. Alg231-50]|uniref:heme biosynthesis HemY N-terminal domain-containing protein n=1 Tax=Anderseniella sp. Alg231-50 TaxID=1922226 RepID=UPI000D5626E0
MISLLVRFVLLIIVATIFAWLADQPGDLKLRWLGYEIETSLMAAFILIAGLTLIVWITWSLLMWLLDRPGAFGGWFKSRRQRKGKQALSSGLIAVASGDSEAAQAHARTAAAIIGDDPMVKLLDAQAAQMRGDNVRVRQLFEEMAEQPETRLLGLRGLHTDAVRQSDMARARALAEEAVRINPKVSWAGKAVLSYQSTSEDWAAISRTIDVQKSASLIDRTTANLKHAVVLTAQAAEAENNNAEDGYDLALRAHKLDPSLVPAAVIAARHATASGSLRKAARIIEKTWNLTPHPDLADAYAHIRSGDSALDRLKRIKSLVAKSGGIEGAVALATAAIDALEWKAAREALSAYAHDRPQARICGLMAEIEEGEFGDKGRAREWLARAVRAPRDPAWTADGFISRTWLPVSPVSGELGGFKWKVPVEGIAYEEPEAAEEEHDDTVPGDDAIAITTPEAPDVADDPEPEEDVVVQKADEPVEDIPAGADDVVEVSEEEPVKDAEVKTSPEPEEKTIEETTERSAGKAEVESPAPDTETQDKEDPPASPVEPDKTDKTDKKAEKTDKDVEAREEASVFARQPDDPGPMDQAGKKPEKTWL